MSLMPGSSRLRPDRTLLTTRTAATSLNVADRITAGFSTTYLCLPDSVDPRGLKSKCLTCTRGEPAGSSQSSGLRSRQVRSEGHLSLLKPACDFPNPTGHQLEERTLIALASQPVDPNEEEGPGWIRPTRNCPASHTQRSPLIPFGACKYVES